MWNHDAAFGRASQRRRWVRFWRLNPPAEGAGGKKRRRRLLGFERLESRQLLHGADLAAAAGHPEGEAAADAMPDFSLTDVNPNSATHDQAVSPRDFLQQVSAWYFGHAT